MTSEDKLSEEEDRVIFCKRVTTVIQVILAHEETIKSLGSSISDQTYDKICDVFENIHSSDYLYRYNLLRKVMDDEIETLIRGSPDRYWQEENQ